ncbi:hypothetical protein [Pedobacter rhodius]|uniref:Lipoprotein n=1 Tax=Pedobacter rhodius TaxID=3004098 RepID=A0ABT4KUR1_9SPHI|nr:hypothetical protein [Pedobacter sp. SJ11]MCZ4222505.1 hypothetical protein [Pedobacter sp. SJ11]
MMRNCVFLILLLTVCSCKRAQKTLLKDADLTIQCIRKVDADVPEQLNFMVRLFPEKDKLADKKDLGVDMQLHMDSCFYTIQDGAKNYPLQVIPVANGVKNCFEYLLVFDNPAGGTEKYRTLTYHDKFINKKTYQLNFE